MTKCMTFSVGSKNKGKKARRKNSVKKIEQTEKKDPKKQKTASPGVEPGLCTRARNSLTSTPQPVTHMFLKMYFVISEQFFAAIDAV